MTIRDCLTWLRILKANQITFKEISGNKKIEALTIAIDIIKKYQIIKQIVDDWNNSGNSAEEWEILDDIERCLNGNDN